MQTEITRAGLYALLWEKPITVLEKELEVSYHELKRICKEKNIPMPASGHWTKARMGKAVSQPVLEDFEGDDKIDLVRFRTVKRIKMPSLADTASLAPLHRPAKFDPLVETVKEYLKGKDVFNNDGLLIPANGYLDVKVSKGNVNRACIILDAFIKMVRKRGHDVIIRNDKSYIVIAGHEIQFNLRERLKRVENPKSQYSFDKWMMVTTGLLLIKMDSWHKKEWIDGKILLDHQLENIVLRMEDEARHKDAFKIQQDKWMLDYRAKEAEKKMIEDRKKKDEEDTRMLLENSKKWQEVQLLRGYIAEVARRNENAATEELVQWLRWAVEKADSMDPFMQNINSGARLITQEVIELLNKLAVSIFSVRAMMQANDSMGSIETLSEELSSEISQFMETRPKEWSKDFETSLRALLESVINFTNEVNKRKEKNELISDALVERCRLIVIAAEALKELMKEELSG